MALEVLPVRTNLQIVVQTGTSDEGNPIYRTRTFRNVKTDAADQDVYDVGAALAGLQQHPVNVIQRLNEFDLVSV